MLLIDSDGVSANFQEGVSRHIPWEEFKLLDEAGQSAKLKEIYKVEPNFFYNLNPIPQFAELIEFAERSGERWMICTSAGRDHPSYIKVQQSKIAWFEKHWGIPSEKIIVTQSSDDKLAYANCHNLLIDDYPRVVDAFKEAGGSSVLVEANRYDVKELIARISATIEEMHLVECGCPPSI